MKVANQIKARHLPILVIGMSLVMSTLAFGEVQDPNKDYDEARGGQRMRPTVTSRPAAAGVSSWLESKVTVAKTTMQSLARRWFGAGDSSASATATTASTTAKTNTAPADSAQTVKPTDANAPTLAMAPVLPGQRAPASADAATTQVSSEMMTMPGLTRSQAGVVKYDIGDKVEAIPRLRLPREERFQDLKVSKFTVGGSLQKMLERLKLAPLTSPTLTDETELRELTKDPVVAQPARQFKDFQVAKGRVDDSALKQYALKQLPAPHQFPGSLAKFVPLTDNEYRFLSGLLLYQQGFRCAAAVGLFHSISKTKEHQVEANYYLATCSKSLGLMTDFSERARQVFESGDGFFSKRLISEVNWETPNVTSRQFGEALEKMMKNPEVSADLKPETAATVAAMIAESAAAAEKFKTAMEWSKRVPDGHPRYLQAKFVEALSEYSIGSKKRAVDIQEALIKNPHSEASAREFQGLIALNLARMYFQENKFKEAHDAFLTVKKDHPLWLQGLTELGWAQLMFGDYEGAIGNMYSIQSPFFAAAYKPESYVIRTIGYLHLCQYGDAYRILSVLEKDYRDVQAHIDSYEKSVGSFKDGRYGTVRRFLQAFSQREKKGDIKELDGLPGSVIREIARQKEFLNLQRSLNRQIDEKASYSKIGMEIDSSLKTAQTKVEQTRRRIEQLRKTIASIKHKPDLAPKRPQLTSELESEMIRLNDQFFTVDLFSEAKRSLAAYNIDVIAGADRRSGDIKTKLEHTIANRITKIRTDLARYLDNNELLRYEVFAASGENIRYQVAGGEKGNRVPATAIPKSKSLQWDFDGEYWEDEIGHYRSSLKNNCPDSSHREQASLGGGAQ